MELTLLIPLKMACSGQLQTKRTEVLKLKINRTKKRGHISLMRPSYLYSHQHKTQTDVFWGKQNYGITKNTPIQSLQQQQ
jgi:hypothetical protein